VSSATRRSAAGTDNGFCDRPIAVSLPNSARRRHRSALAALSCIHADGGWCGVDACQARSAKVVGCGDSKRGDRNISLALLFFFNGAKIRWPHWLRTMRWCVGGHCPTRLHQARSSAATCVESDRDPLSGHRFWIRPPALRRAADSRRCSISQRFLVSFFFVYVFFICGRPGPDGRNLRQRTSGAWRRHVPWRYSPGRLPGA